MRPPIELIGVKQNNLKNFDLSIPQYQLTVITGLSGSGKSSLAFETLYAEGQRRYIESLSTYTRQFLEKMPKPNVERIRNIPPSIALEQRNSVMNSRSTVGTQTEVVDYLRILFAKIGKTHCLNCNAVIEKLNRDSILSETLKWLPNKKAYIAAPYVLQKKIKSEGLVKVLLSQGYRRILIRNKKNELEVIQLEEPDDQKRIGKTLTETIYIVTDRIRLTENEDADTRNRIADSVTQALAIGKGTLLLWDESENLELLLHQRFACKSCGISYIEPTPLLFSFQSPIGACSGCSGFGYVLRVDPKKVIPNPKLSLKEGAIEPFTKPSMSEWQDDLLKEMKKKGIRLDIPYIKLSKSHQALILQFVEDRFEELKKWKYKLPVRVFIRRYQEQALCTECGGTRLKKEALAVKIQNQNFSEILELPIHRCLNWLRTLKLSKNELKIVEEIYHQVERRLALLDEVGVGYLTLSRLTKTLSGGEFQRINLATQLGNGLCGTLYVLDEPSIGLHASDTKRLIQVLHKLRDQGNTVVVVEHDPQVMQAADFLVELGPGAGLRGGELIAFGTLEQFKQSSSITARYLSESKHHCERMENFKRRMPSKRFIELYGCKENNLKNIDVRFPLDRLVVVTGVSGSGKSTLIHKTLFPALMKAYDQWPSGHRIGVHKKLIGADQISGVHLMDQSPIGKNSRSNPATFIKAWDEIRRIYSNQTLSVRKGYTPQHFSFNVDGGRCPVCKGEGEITLDMHFMAEIKIPCEECEGKRFKKNILEVTYRNKNIDQLLNMTIDEAYELFRDNSILQRKLGILRDVGLGYLRLGQSASTLSGGESQRLKIAATLEGQNQKNYLYLFDEPTTGLHLEDVKKLLAVLHNLIDSGNSIIMIEHHLEVISEADWVIDLGPSGGENGGEIIAAGTPEDLVLNPKSVTGQSLHEHGYFDRNKLYNQRRGTGG